MTSKFKAIHSSDHHHGLETSGSENPLTGLNTRTEDGIKALSRLADYAIEQAIKLYIISGDIFNHKAVNQNVTNAFWREIIRMRNAGIYIVILEGNHDCSRLLLRKNALDLGNTLGLENIYITRGDNNVLDLGYVQIAAVSYWRTADEINEDIHEIAKKIDWKRPAILVAHLQIDYPDFPGAFKADLPFTPLNILTQHPWTYIAVGHIHKNQKLNDNPPCYYGGSLVRCTAAEETEKKGFMTFEVEGTKAINIKQIVDNECLQYKTLKGTPKEIQKVLSKIKDEDLSRFIIRIQVDESEEPLDIQLIRDKLKTCFDYTITKEAKSKALETKKIDVKEKLGFEHYVKEFFNDDKDKNEIVKVFAELNGRD